MLVSDYDKGVCTPAVLSAVFAAARGLNLRVLADPIRKSDYQKYHGCAALTPNRLEAGLATGRTLHTTAEVLAAADQLQEQLDLEAAVITLDKDGMALAHKDGRRQLFPTRPRQVYDITGAGDMVLSVLALALAAGADYEEAIPLANVAGGLEVEKIGAATVTRDEILRDLLHGGTRVGAGVVLGALTLARPRRLLAWPTLIGADARPVPWTHGPTGSRFQGGIRGLLSAQVPKVEELAADDIRAGLPRFDSANVEKNLPLRSALEAIARRKNVTLAQLSIAWPMAQGSRAGAFIVPIPGAKSRRHLEENVRSAEIVLTADDLAEIDRIVPPGAASGTRYPIGQMHRLNI